MITSRVLDVKALVARHVGARPALQDRPTSLSWRGRSSTHAGRTGRHSMAGGRPLRVLCLDDSPPDVELVAATLTRAGYQLELDCGGRPHRLRSAARRRAPRRHPRRLRAPRLRRHEALELAKVACPGTPFICVSGTIGEEITVELLKRGADDIVLKDRMARLPFAVQRAVDERAGAATLAGSERRFRSLFENLLNGYSYCRIIYDDSGEPVDFVYLEVNPAFKLLTGLRDVEGRPVSEVIPGVHHLSPELVEVCGRVAHTGAPRPSSSTSSRWARGCSSRSTAPSRGRSSPCSRTSPSAARPSRRSGGRRRPSAGPTWTCSMR